MKDNLKNIFLKSIGFIFNLIGYFNPKLAIKTALHLFSKPRKGKITHSNQEKYLSNAYLKSIKIDDYNIAIYKFGNGNKTILLIHGWESNTYRWRKLIKFLGDEYTFLALDAPAHGNSSGEIYSSLVYAKATQQIYDEYKPHVIIGHSMGGQTMLYSVANFNMSKDTKLIVLASPHSLEYIFDLYYYNIGLSKKLRKLTPEYFKQIYGLQLSSFSIEVFGKNIENETLIIHDVDDKLNSFFCAEIINRAVKNSILIKTENYNHSLQFEAVFNYIKEFIDK